MLKQFWIFWIARGQNWSCCAKMICIDGGRFPLHGSMEFYSQYILWGWQGVGEDRMTRLHEEFLSIGEGGVDHFEMLTPWSSSIFMGVIDDVSIPGLRQTVLVESWSKAAYLETWDCCPSWVRDQDENDYALRSEEVDALCLIALQSEHWPRNVQCEQCPLQFWSNVSNWKLFFKSDMHIIFWVSHCTLCSKRISQWAVWK